MIKAETIIEFTLGKFDELKNIQRANAENKEKGRLYVGDTFECTEEMCEYLTGKNPSNATVIKILEVLPVKEKQEIKEQPKKENTKKTTKRTTRKNKK
jgi:hypothetical protein